MLNRKLAAASAAGAMVVGGFAALAAPAYAASTSATLRGDFACSVTYGSGARAMVMKTDFGGRVKVTVDGSKATGTPDDLSAWSYNGGALPDGFAIKGADIAVSAELNGSAHMLNGSSDDVNFPTSGPTGLPSVSGDSNVTDIATGKLTGISGTVDLFVPFSGTTVPVPLTCTGTGSDWLPAHEAPAGGTFFDCSMSLFDKDYVLPMPTPVDVTAEAKGGNVEISAQLGVIPITSIPAPLADVPFTAVMKGAVNGVATEFKGESRLNQAPRTDLPTPALKATVASTATSVDVSMGDITFVATHPSLTVQVDCIADPHTVKVDVKAEPKPPVVKAAPTKSVSKVAYNKKKKTAVVTTTVKAGKKNATGKVTVVVKKGKKVVSKKTLTLKNGKVTLKLSKKQLKAKGVYTVTANYAGAKAFKKSAAKKVTFRVK